MLVAIITANITTRKFHVTFRDLESGCFWPTHWIFKSYEEAKEFAAKKKIPLREEA